MRRRAAMGLGLAAVTGAVPLVAPVPPATANHNGCQTRYACYWGGPDRTGTQWATQGNVPDIGGWWYITESGFNHGTSGMRACAYFGSNYDGLQISLARGQFKNYSSRAIASHKWVAADHPGGCPE